MPKQDASFHPIIYVRGYAGSQSEVEETVATPYMGFNLGSTKIRQRWSGAVERLIFESPLVRLMKDYEYRDIYVDGAEALGNASKIPERPLVIYRYYDQVSKELGEGERPDIPTYARGLAELVARLRDQICGGDDDARKAFKVYLVAHSMGGLVCRCFLQNPDVDPENSRAHVDKVFTYATPHDGIELRVIGNVPGFFTRNNANNFNRKEMAGYLKLDGTPDHVNTLDGKFDADRFFCLVGTNFKDYTVGGGVVSTVVGPMSDGLVLIQSASVRGAPRAFIHRSHSGHYGIVNSEEGYQNLKRFLFGDVRVDGRLVVDEITLPTKVQKAHDSGKEIRASYHFEAIVRPRQARYDLHRRVVDEGSAVFRTFDEMLRSDTPRHPKLFSTFLMVEEAKRRGPLVFAVDLNVMVPEYEIDGFLFFDDHVAGSYLYRETIILAASPPDDDSKEWSVRYSFYSRSATTSPSKSADVERVGDSLVFKVPIRSPGNRRPGIKATLELTARPWNRVE